MLALAKRLTIDQWEALFEQYPVERGTTEDHLKLLGLFFVACVVLIVNDDFANLAWQLFPWEAPRSGSIEWRFWRRMGWVWCISFSYLVPPYLYCRYVMGLRARDLGLTTRGFVEHLPLYFFFFAVVAPCVVVVSYDEHFQRTYPLAGDAWRHRHWLLLWETSYAGQFLGVEFFFRGVLLFATVRLMGPWCIPMMVVPYCMLHFGKPWMEAAGSIVAGATLGVVALRTRSILAGVCIHTAVAWSMDFLALLQKGHLAKVLGWD